MSCNLVVQQTRQVDKANIVDARLLHGIVAGAIARPTRRVAHVFGGARARIARKLALGAPVGLGAAQAKPIVVLTVGAAH